MYLSENLKLLREQKGWSCKQLEMKSGVKQQTISLIESTKTINPNLLTLIKLAKMLNVSIDELLYSDLSVHESEEDIFHENKLLQQKIYIVQNKLDSIKQTLGE